jgi:hypothetical protein
MSRDGAKMTEPESGVADTADPQTLTTPTRNAAPRPRRWWQKPAGAAAATIVLAAVAAGGYFGINALMPKSARQTASPSTSSTVEQIPGPPKGLPLGAAPCESIDTDIPGPFNAGARGTPATSCPFVEQVRKEYAAQRLPSSGPVQLKVVSPQTSKWYYVACLGSGDYVTCTGGAGAVIYLYHR